MPRRMNRKIVLHQRPKGEVTPDCLRLVAEPAPEPKDGEALVRNLYLSLDPTQQGWMKYDTYMPAIPIGDVIRSGGVGEVIESRSPLYTKGQLVSGLVGWQEYAIADGGGRRMQSVPAGISAEDAVSVFGITGLTAYFGLLDVGKPKAGETVVVSGAAGATGSVVGQIAKLVGCRVVGIAGGPEKCRWLVRELGFDAAVDYKGEDVGKALAAACPKGVDVYFDNVGGEILDAVLLQLNRHARVSLCGAISTYSEEAPPPGPRNLMMLVMKHAHMEGFLVLDYVARFPEAIAAMSKWKAEGKLHSRVDVVDGIENTPAAFRRLFTGGNTGKLLVRVG
jgi:NADPH-dependent curcumin reductase